RVIPGTECVDAYIIERTWLAIDDCGNSDSCIQVIAVIDTTPPIINCPANVTIECSESSDPSNTGVATASDNCTDEVTNIQYNDQVIAGNCEGSYVIERTWIAIDECGNSSSCIQV